ncbi:MAG: ABC transporter substrate-binding protein [Chloroflexi bacterium]|nr:ABC transporter substrate-binding protein [Chloroflexota bacterium]
MLAKRQTLIVAASVVTAVVLGAVIWMVLFRDDGPPDPAWEKIQREKQLVVAIDPSYPPFAQYGDPVPVGIDADLAQAIADEWGVEVHFSWQGYDGLYDSLLLRHVDIIISAIRSDPLRTDLIYYTQPYLDAGQVFVGIENAPQDFMAVEQDDVIAVEFASDGAIAAQQHELRQVIETQSSAEAIQMVLDGNADYALVDRISAGEFANQVVISGPVVSDLYSIAIRRENWRLARNVEETLLKFKNNGTLDEIVTTWLGYFPEP